MDDNAVLKEVVFAILMQDILGKAPSYLEEKRQFINGCNTGDEAAGILLDCGNMYKYKAYKKHWEID